MFLLEQKELMSTSEIVICGLLAISLESLAAETSRAPGAVNSTIQFTAHRVGQFRSEAVAVADFNGDRKLDIVAGAYLYLAPDWKPVKIRSVSGSVDQQGKGYYDDFMNLALDVDGDGKPDVVSCGWFSKSVRWHRNTLGKDGDWPEAVAYENGNFECGDLADIDGDGQAREILAHTAATVWLEMGVLPSGQRGWLKHVVSEKGMNFGGGVGDINGDGRPDILRPDAWFEGPADARQGRWIEHTWAMGANDSKAEHTPQMLVYDVNQDGLADVITSSAHQYGIFWYEQVRAEGKTSWKQHLIDDTWSQAHSLALADLNGDGTPDLVTGKRFMAHNGGDPDEYGKLGVYWYELRRAPKPQWLKHVISYDQGISSGMNVCAADLDGDGDLDVVVTGKWGGPVWFENSLKSHPTAGSTKGLTNPFFVFDNGLEGIQDAPQTLKELGYNGLGTAHSALGAGQLRCGRFPARTRRRRVSRANRASMLRSQGRQTRKSQTIHPSLERLREAIGRA
jgi:hypothetical protein